MMKLIQRYDAAIDAGEIQSSKAQRQAVLILDEMRPTLAMRTWFFRRKACQGLYLYGPVGVGKTYVLDLFYNIVGDVPKARYHFHHFMQYIDAELRRLQGIRNPLERVAKRLASSARLLCLDEFLVHDVADALILADLLKQLISLGVVLVITANTRPDDLYLDGVHRERFIPAIELIKVHCTVMVLDDKADHRLGKISLPKAYLTPVNDENDAVFAAAFSSLSGQTERGGVIKIQNRDITYVKKGDVAIWFDFNVICSLPRSPLDYLEIADKYQTIFVSNVPVILPDDTTHALLLIHFIDVLYDKKAHLVLLAAAPPEGLYAKGPMRQTFLRTESRLKEMQSREYWSKSAILRRKVGDDDAL